jgi:hypothetical protein
MVLSEPLPDQQVSVTYFTTGTTGQQRSLGMNHMAVSLKHETVFATPAEPHHWSHQGAHRQHASDMGPPRCVSLGDCA